MTPCDGPVRAKPNCQQVVSPEVARAAIDAARCTTGYRRRRAAVRRLVHRAGSVRSTVGRPVAGKTGTTDNTRSAWFVGNTPELAAAAFVADPDNPFNAVGDGQAQKPIDAVANALKEALKDKPVRKFIPPSDAIVGSGS